MNEPDVVVEGDDGVFRLDGPALTRADFTRLGFSIKLERESDLGRLGFCQLFFADPADGNVVEPYKFLVEGGWTNSQAMDGGTDKMEALALAKAYSCLAEAPRNPVTSKMALWVIRATKGVRPAPADSFPDKWWMSQCLSGNLEKCFNDAQLGPSMRQRLLVEEKWKISVREQVEIEDYFDAQETLHPINLSVALKVVSRERPWNCWAWQTLLDPVRRGSRVC